ncbi:hypothetical protein T07_6751 [Trichinella nelsoni]|uniref:Uncharacterized protein n=1 Tax=Trichinella nelsoni TaxID=6336 RepID=A0A0V0S8C5_9BILA|nr:hypothetical protein T07_6751 [Trichinella nelsoni]
MLAISRPACPLYMFWPASDAKSLANSKNEKRRQLLQIDSDLWPTTSVPRVDRQGQHGQLYCSIIKSTTENHRVSDVALNMHFLNLISPLPYHNRPTACHSTLQTQSSLSVRQQLQ